MKYLSCSDVSKKMNISVRIIQQMCKDGDFCGAVKDGHAWMIPDDSINKKMIVKKTASSRYYRFQACG